MRWQNVRRRKVKKKRGRRIEKLKFETLLGLLERKSFSTLANVIIRQGIPDDWKPIDNAHQDFVTLYVFKKYIFDEYDIDIDEELLSDIELFYKALFSKTAYNPNEINKDGDTLLHLLCKTSKSILIVEALLKREDVDLNIVDKFDCTPLDMCILYKNEEARQILSEMNAMTGEEVGKLEKKKQKESETFASLEEYREMKVNNFYPKTANIKRLLDPNVLDKKWI